MILGAGNLIQPQFRKFNDKLVEGDKKLNHWLLLV